MPRDEAVVARRLLRLGALVIKEQPLARRPEPGLRKPWPLRCARGRRPAAMDRRRPPAAGRVALLAAGPRTGWPDLGDAALLARLGRMAGARSGHAAPAGRARRAGPARAAAGAAGPRQRRELDRRAPGQLEPSRAVAGRRWTTAPTPGARGKAAGTVRALGHAHDQRGPHAPDAEAAVHRRSGPWPSPATSPGFGPQATPRCARSCADATPSTLGPRPAHSPQTRSGAGDSAGAAIGWRVQPFEHGGRVPDHGVAFLGTAGHARSMPWFRIAIGCCTCGAGAVICSRRAGTSAGKVRPKSLAALKHAAAGARPPGAPGGQDRARHQQSRSRMRIRRPSQGWHRIGILHR